MELGELFRAHGPAVYRRAFRLLGSRADAEEATQEVFLRVMRSAERDDRRAAVTTWLYEVTTNYCLNRLRDGRRRAQLLSQKSPVSDDARANGHDDLLTVRKLLAAADERQARAAIHVYVDGMSQAEAAELMGVSQRTVSNLLERFVSWAREHTDLIESDTNGGGAP